MRMGRSSTSKPCFSNFRMHFGRFVHNVVWSTNMWIGLALRCSAFPSHMRALRHRAHDSFGLYATSSYSATAQHQRHNCRKTILSKTDGRPFKFCRSSIRSPSRPGVLPKPARLGSARTARSSLISATAASALWRRQLGCCEVVEAVNVLH